MNRTFLLRPLSPAELEELQQLLRADNAPASLYRRGMLIWLLAGGASIAEAAEYVDLHYTNAHAWVQRFKVAGLAGLATHERSGRPHHYGPEVTDLIVNTATSRPGDLGLGFTTWSLAKLEQQLRRQAGLERLSRETIRRLLGQQGLRFLTGQTWCESTDPDFEAKKTPL